MCRDDDAHPSVTEHALHPVPTREHVARTSAGEQVLGGGHRASVLVMGNLKMLAVGDALRTW
jgi:hypothetical protein